MDNDRPKLLAALMNLLWMCLIISGIGIPLAPYIEHEEQVNRAKFSEAVGTGITDGHDRRRLRIPQGPGLGNKPVEWLPHLFHPVGRLPDRRLRPRIHPPPAPGPGQSTSPSPPETGRALNAGRQG